MELRDIKRVSLRLSLNPIPSLGLYIHVPFCRVRCPFCPFYVEIHRQQQARSFLDSLKRELCVYSEMIGFHDVPLASVYVGGGTPTTLTTAELRELLAWIQEGFSLTPDVEVSIEVHPGTVTENTLKELRTAGFNRLSLGIQSFDGQELNRLGGRILNQGPHATVTQARSAGFQNISLDLMYGFPGHTLDAWQYSLDKAIALSPEHLSCYAFTVEEGTYFYDEVTKGHVSMPEDGFQLLLEEEAITRLSEFGYERYEVSNFSQVGYECRHNTRYWQGRAYLGVGPSAQSYVDGVRFGNTPNLNVYNQCLEETQLPLEGWDDVPVCRADRENIVFGLRMLNGVVLNNLSEILQTDEEWNRGIQSMQQKGLLKIEDGHLRLTASGIQHADTVAVALL